MEDAEVMRRRREKILARMNPNDLLDDSQQPKNNDIQQLERISPLEKLKIINKMDEIQLRNRKVNLVLSTVLGLFCGALHSLIALHFQFVLLWGTLLFLLSSFQNIKLKIMEKSIKILDHTENFLLPIIQMAFGKYIKNPRILGTLLDNSDFIIKIIKQFQCIAEGLLLFTFFFIIVHIVI